MITPRQSELVQKSWEKVRPIAAKAAELFYGRLFVLDPSLRQLFSGDMAEQGEKLMKTLQVAVNGLGNLDSLVPVLENLGHRHVAYGVEPEHYATVGEALIGTLEQGLGAAFTLPVRHAWVDVYAFIARTMMAAARAAGAEPARDAA